MHGKNQFCSSLFHINSRAATAALAIAGVFALTIVFSQSAQAQTYNVIHNFSDGADGSYPAAGLTTDAAGNLYGTTCGAVCAPGANSNGTVFRLAQKNSAWILTPLYAFRGGNDGAGPAARVIFGPDGTLYGTTYQGGGSGCGGAGCGTVFRLQPPPSAGTNVLGGWIETVLYRFQGGSDGSNPYPGDLTFDQASNIYGTTWSGGAYGQGTVFELMKSQNGWAESLLYSFAAGSDGAEPSGGLAWDCGGMLEGTTFYGGSYGYGTIFSLASSASGWTENIIYSFQGGTDGANPVGGVFADCAEIGTTSQQGRYGGGTAFLLHDDLFHVDFQGLMGPWAALSAANDVIYGTTYEDGAYQSGSVFSLEGCAGWGMNSLHDFTGDQDGGYPISSLIIQGGSVTKIFGTASAGGANGHGVVFEITTRGTDFSACAAPWKIPK
jgi:hypothetical protein